MKPSTGNTIVGGSYNYAAEKFNPKKDIQHECNEMIYMKFGCASSSTHSFIHTPQPSISAKEEHATTLIDNMLY